MLGLWSMGESLIAARSPGLSPGQSGYAIAGLESCPLAMPVPLAGCRGLFTKAVELSGSAAMQIVHLTLCLLCYLC